MNSSLPSVCNETIEWNLTKFNEINFLFITPLDFDQGAIDFHISCINGEIYESVTQTGPILRQPMRNIEQKQSQGMKQNGKNTDN